MNLIACPHCGNERIVAAKTPKDVVVVLTCPSCQELVVLFRRKVIALQRQVIESGSFEEKKSHIAEVIAEFLEPGMFNAVSEESGEELQELFEVENDEEVSADGEDSDDTEPISESEFDRFVRVDLKRLDDASYFRKHFS
jgi:hypothetical protein